MFSLFVRYGNRLPKTLQFWAFFAEKLLSLYERKNGLAIFITVWLNVKRWVVLITFISRCRLFVLKASSIKNKVVIFLDRLEICCEFVNFVVNSLFIMFDMLKCKSSAWAIFINGKFLEKKGGLYLVDLLIELVTHLIDLFNFRLLYRNYVFC